MKIQVRAIPESGHAHRYRAGMKFGIEPQTLTVLEDGQAPDLEQGQISLAQYGQIKSDPRLAVNAEGANDEVIVKAQAEIAAKDAELVAAKRELAAAAELYDEHQAIAEKHALEAQNEIMRLRAQLAEAQEAIAKQAPPEKPSKGGK